MSSKPPIMLSTSGPEGDHKGGEVLAHGIPEEIAAVEASFTGQFLKEYLI